MQLLTVEPCQLTCEERPKQDRDPDGAPTR